MKDVICNSPIDALAIAIEWAFLSSQGFKPGIVVNSLPENVREQLRKLTSDDSLKLRIVYL